MIDIIIGVIAGAIVIGSIILAIINKKKGKTSCGCNCNGCPMQCSKKNK